MRFLRRWRRMSLTQTDIDSLLNAATDLADEAQAPSASTPDPAPSASSVSPPPRAQSALARSMPPEVRRILSMRVPVIVKLAEQTMPVSAILKLTSGSILEFERSADAELELLANNKVIGHGQAVKVGENFGLRISQMSSIKNTIEALSE